MSIGVSYELFWHLNPAKLKPFEEAYKMAERKRDEQAWLCGYYNYVALSAVISNFSAGLSGRHGHERYIEQPLTYQQAEQEMQKRLAEDPEYQQNAMVAFLNSLAANNSDKEVQ